MAKNLEQCRVCRRAGTKLYLKGDRCFTPKCAIVKRNYAPGVHGAKRGGRPARLTPYAIQLREKQKAKFYYGISEKQFRNYFEKAAIKVGDTPEFMLSMLETRLDSVVYRLGWVWSRKDARQLVSHGAILVNGRKVTIPSFHVRVGDRITVHPSKEKNTHFTQVLPGLEKHTVPAWLHSEKGSFGAKVVSLPKRPEDTVAIFDMKPIIEFYSR
ncbi:30S ribosomal protein S4 [Candidatus Uhrbacteria bacterium]|nr:30S ribosomal protein S4 [Candidatus Uhrbacteria bacterium]